MSRVIPPGHADSTAVDTRYGRWGTASGPGRSYQTVDDEKGVLTTSVHDAYGRMQYAIADSAGTSAATRNNRTSFAYDALDRLTSTTMPERGTATSPMTATSRYAYDHLGNVRVKKVTIDGLTGDKTVEYAHDLAGRVTRLIYPDGAQARYTYDGAGRLSRVWDAQGNTLAAFTRTAAGNIATHVVGDDVVTGAYTYNPREWVTRIDYAGTFNSTLTYDNAGNVTRQVYRHGTAASKTADYAYDNLYRITDFDLTGGVSEDFTYDRSGNIKTVASGGSTLTYRYTPDSTPNRLNSTTGSGGQTYTYNPNGWMTGNGADTLSYDYRGLTTGYGSARYLMDPDRRRVKKTVGTSTTFYLRGANGSVLAEYDRNQALTARYVYAGARRVARLAGSGASYYLADHLGSTRSLVDGSGTVTAAYDYRPYGKVLATSGTDATRFRFTGHERDDESGLDYMLERSYAYDTGRFLRPDPMQDEYPGLSPYAYANNNPLKYVDPDGRIPIVPFLVAGWALAELGLSAYDVYDAVSTALDPDATTGQKLFSAGGALAGVVLPGGGYSAVDNVAESLVAASKTLSKNSDKAASDAAVRAKDIQNSLNPRAQRARTTAVTETEEGIRVVSSSERRLTPAQRAQLGEKEIEGTGIGHAEMTGLNAAREAGLTPTGTAASRPICSNCADVLKSQGVEILSPLKR